MNARKPITELDNPSSINRARRREQAEANLPPITPDDQARLRKLEALIDQTLADCAKGPTVGRAKKKNPAFQNLVLLFRARTLLTSGRSQAKSTDEILAAFDSFLSPKEIAN